jgi:general secretion pathway protein A
VGQPELRQYIATKKSLAALRQRIVLAKHLRPLSAEDVARYVEHRLSIASVDRGAVAVKFDRAAMHRIHQVTHGIPRLINVVCDNALLLGYVNETRMIGAAIINRVIEDLVPNFGNDSDSGVTGSSMQLGLAA